MLASGQRSVHGCEKSFGARDFVEPAELTGSHALPCGAIVLDQKPIGRREECHYA
jgi:hypothetical protein